MQLTTWRRLAALALLLAAAALAVAGCDRRASDPARPSIGSTPPGITQSITQGTPADITPSLSPGITSGITSDTTPSTAPGTTTGSGIRVLDSLSPALHRATAAPVMRQPP